MEFYDAPQPPAHYDDDCYICQRRRPVGMTACSGHGSAEEWRWQSEWERHYKTCYCKPHIDQFDRDRLNQTPSLF